MLRLCSLLVLLALPLSAETLSGRARVIDGDTLELSGARVRLFGIDAPELSQTCTRGGGDWRCGDWAKRELSRLVAGASIACEERDRDRYGRIVATCRAAGSDIGEAMVRIGAAFAYRRYSQDYLGAERSARAEAQGIWAGTVEAPSEMRAAERAKGASGAPAGCAIKGNVSQGGRIYHLPGQENYAATRIDPGRGERWFCSEAEASAAGWRRARR